MTTPIPSPEESLPTEQPTPAASDAPAATAAPQPKYRRGDLVFIPCHNGNYVAEVVHIYGSLEEAEDQYPQSFRTILQAPRKKPKSEQFFYYCEINNKTRKHVGVAEEHAKLKYRKPETPDVKKAKAD